GAAQPLRARAALLLVAEHAHVDAGVAQIGACPDIGHGHESHPGVLQLTCHRIADHLAYGLVDPTHASRGHPTPRPSRTAASAAARLARMRTFSPDPPH